MSARILIVEDNPAILEANRQALVHEGYEVMIAENLAQARLTLTKSPPDLFVLDILLPDGSGIDFLSELREHTTAPVLILSSLKKWEQQLEGIRKGGDDYITKPYRIEELRVRVAALLRRVRLDKENYVARTVIKGPLTLDIVASQAFLSGKDMLLTQKEFALLLLLVQNEGKALSKEYLFESAWKQPMAEDDTAIKTAVSRLRTKLASCGFVITALRGEGYQYKISC